MSVIQKILCKKSRSQKNSIMFSQIQWFFEKISKVTKKILKL